MAVVIPFPRVDGPLPVRRERDPKAEKTRRPGHTPGGFLACTAGELAAPSRWLDGDAYRGLLAGSDEWYSRHHWRRMLVRVDGRERAERGDHLATRRVAWMHLVDTFRRDAFAAMELEAECRSRVTMLERMLRRGGVCECRPYSAKTIARTVVFLARAREQLASAEARLDALSHATPPPAYRDYAARPEHRVHIVVRPRSPSRSMDTPDTERMAEPGRESEPTRS